ncbi:MAG: DUF58 domain-containing protein [Lachnospiraceae bacterium]|nr:DUF58 domain-containing protein [Lachnospiraceae bacterium]
MWGQRLIFILIYAALVALEIAFPDPLLAAAQVAMLLLLAVSGLVLLLQSFRLSGGIGGVRSNKTLYATRNEPVEIPLHVKNRFPLPVLRARVRLFYRTFFDRRPEKYEIVTYVSGGCETVFTLHFVPEHCGVHEWTMRDVTIYDWFGFFRRRIRVTGTGTMIVRPSLKDPLPEESGEMAHQDMADSEQNRHERHLEESDFYQDDEVGDLPPELLDIRPFRQGDRMREIHWKLSAKKEDWFVREYSLPQKAYTVVFFDYMPENEDEADRLLLRLAKTCEDLVSEERAALLFWYDESRHVFVRHLLMNHDDLHDVIDEACKMPPNQKEHFSQYAADAGHAAEKILRIG